MIPQAPSGATVSWSVREALSNGDHLAPITDLVIKCGNSHDWGVRITDIFRQNRLCCILKVGLAIWEPTEQGGIDAMLWSPSNDP